MKRVPSRRDLVLPAPVLVLGTAPSAIRAAAMGTRMAMASAMGGDCGGCGGEDAGAVPGACVTACLAAAWAVLPSTSFIEAKPAPGLPHLGPWIAEGRRYLPARADAFAAHIVDFPGVVE